MGGLSSLRMAHIYGELKDKQSVGLMLDLLESASRIVKARGLSCFRKCSYFLGIRKKRLLSAIDFAHHEWDMPEKISGYFCHRSPITFRKLRRLLGEEIIFLPLALQSGDTIFGCGERPKGDS